MFLAICQSALTLPMLGGGREMIFKTRQTSVVCKCSFRLNHLLRSCPVILCKLKMRQTIELWYAIEFRVGLNKSGTETSGINRRAFKEKNISQTTVFKYYKIFKNARESIEYELIVGRPLSSRIDDILQRVHELLLNSEHRLSVNMVTDEIGIDKMTMNNVIITKNLTIRKICVKFVPKFLTDG